jgi:outer membrane protein TolC
MIRYLNKIIASSVLLLLFQTPALAQNGNLLTLEEAIQIGLENNYDIQLVRYSSEIAANNRSLGNAGFLPSVSLNAGMTERVEDSESRFRGANPPNVVSGARSSTRNYGASLSWTLFNGLQMFTTYEKLGELEAIGQIELQLQIEQTLSQIITAYINIIRISEQLKVLQNTIEVSRERVEIAETKLDVGSGSEYELLQARTDFNSDRAALLREQNNLTNAKIELNELLVLSADSDYEVLREIPLNYALNYDDLFQAMESQNKELRIAKAGERIAMLEIKEIKGERFPELILSSGYGYNRNELGSGFIEFSESEGFNVGLTARINLFNGFETNRRIQNAQINQKTRQLAVEAEQQRIVSDLLAFYRFYRNSLELIELEEENLENATETLDIALERFRLGTISALEFREAQRTFLAAESRLLNTRYEAKQAETNLLRISGQLQEVIIE